LTSVSGDLLEAAAAMGYTGRQRLFAVQFPISIPVIGAGLRVAAVSNVSLISVASLVGVQQLGALFVRGSQTVTLVPIVLGVIIIMLLAFAFDAVILLGIRLMTPWQRAVRAR
jgi:osmoprotectant transport system permease protein